MPKLKGSGITFAKSLPGGSELWEYIPSTNQIFCKLCILGMDYSSSNIKFRVQQHISSAKHFRHVNLHNPRQTVISSSSSSTSTDTSNAYYKDLCNAFIRSNIPLYKLENPHLKSFLEKYTEKVLPSELSAIGISARCKPCKK